MTTGSKHAFDHRPHRLSKGRVQEIGWQGRDVTRDGLSDQELTYLVRKVVAVVVQKMIGIRSVCIPHVVHKLHKDLLWNLGFAHVDALNGISVLGCSWDGAHDALAIEKFAAKDDNRCMVDGVYYSRIALVFLQAGGILA